MNSDKKILSKKQELSNCKEIILTYNGAIEFEKEEVTYKKDGKNFNGHIIRQNRNATIRLFFNIEQQGSAAFYHLICYTDTKNHCTLEMKDSDLRNDQYYIPEYFDVIYLEEFETKWYKEDQLTPIDKKDFDNYIEGDMEIIYYSINSKKLINLEIRDVNNEVLEFDIKNCDILLDYLKGRILKNTVEDFKGWYATANNEDIVKALNLIHKKTQNNDQENLKNAILKNNTVITFEFNGFFFCELSDVLTLEVELVQMLQDFLTNILELNYIDSTKFSFKSESTGDIVICNSIDELEVLLLNIFKSTKLINEELAIPLDSVSCSFILTKDIPFKIINDFCLHNSNILYSGSGFHIICELSDRKISYQGYFDGELDDSDNFNTSDSVINDNHNYKKIISKHKKLLLK